jgi:hypothetical protein
VVRAVAADEIVRPRLSVGQMWAGLHGARKGVGYELCRWRIRVVRRWEEATGRRDDEAKRRRDAASRDANVRLDDDGVVEAFVRSNEAFVRLW